VTAPIVAGRVELIFLRLNAEIQRVHCWQLVLHPNVFTVFERLVFMTGRRDAMKAKLAQRFEEAVPILFRLANCFHSLGRSIEAKLTINPLPNPKRKSNAIGAKPEFLPRHYLSVSFCIR
jgi:hypothetical protein